MNDVVSVNNYSERSLFEGESDVFNIRQNF